MENRTAYFLQPRNETYVYLWTRTQFQVRIACSVMLFSVSFCSWLFLLVLQQEQVEWDELNKVLQRHGFKPVHFADPVENKNHSGKGQWLLI